MYLPKSNIIYLFYKHIKYCIVLGAINVKFKYVYNPVDVKENLFCERNVKNLIILN
jgi:hypothetical protein